MEWIFDHLQILIAAGAAVAYWFNQRQQVNSESEEPEGDYLNQGPVAIDEDDRAHQIREEIRRKIAERASGGGMRGAESNEVPPPLFNQREVHPQPAFESPFEEQDRDQGSGYMIEADPAVLEQQRKLQAQLQALEQARKIEQQKAEEIKVAPVAPNGAESFRNDLRRIGSLRRAIVLREVLGPPVALR